MQKMMMPTMAMILMQKILINEGAIVKWVHFSHSHFLFGRLCCGRIFRYLSISRKGNNSISNSCIVFSFIMEENDKKKTTSD